MAEYVHRLNKQYRMYYIERMSFGTEKGAYDDMILYFPPFVSNAGD